MGEASKIEWTDSTFNPWEGCQRVGPGCDHCYAEAFNARFNGGAALNWGAGAPRRRTSTTNWQQPRQWQRKAEAFHAEHGRLQRVFCASLGDVFDNEVPHQWRVDLFTLIAETPDLDWLLLTKRIGNVLQMLPPLHWPWDNVWLGITVVHQAEADRDIPKLLAVPAAKRFLSIEPMLGPIDVVPYIHCDVGNAVDWVIVGGESGPNARPMHPDWVRSLRDQCAAAGVPFLFKQWGEWTPGENVERVRGTVDTAFLHDDGWRVHPLNLATDHDHIDDQPDLYRVGKKAAGRWLDGIEHNGFPT